MEREFVCPAWHKPKLNTFRKFHWKSGNTKTFFDFALGGGKFDEAKNWRWRDLKAKRSRLKWNRFSTVCDAGHWNPGRQMVLGGRRPRERPRRGPSLRLALLPVRLQARLEASKELEPPQDWRPRKWAQFWRRDRLEVVSAIRRVFSYELFRNCLYRDTNPWL